MIDSEENTTDIDSLENEAVEELDSALGADEDMSAASDESSDVDEVIAAAEGVEEFASGTNDVAEELHETIAEGTELEAFESAEIEDTEFIDSEQMLSILEAVLFATDKPQSVAVIKQAFKATNIKTKDIKRGLNELQSELADSKRGVSLEEVAGGYQLRTKVDNMTYLKRMAKGRAFKLSGPALEVLAIVAYKQPCIKFDVDEIRGVESGHLLRGLMERNMVSFAGKSEAPGKPMLYATTKKFLEIFGLRNLRELPSLAEIDNLIPEGIGDIEEKEETLGNITSEMSQDAGDSYSEGEEELTRISDQLSTITTSSDFFEQEKQRQKDKKEADRAQDIRDAMVMGEEVAGKDKKWLERYDAKRAELQAAEKAESEERSDPEQTEMTVTEVVAEEAQVNESVNTAESSEAVTEVGDVVENEEQVIAATEEVVEDVAAVETAPMSAEEVLAQVEEVEVSAPDEGEVSFSEKEVQPNVNYVSDDRARSEIVRTEILEAKASLAQWDEEESADAVSDEKLKEDMEIFDEPTEESV